jgi:hypothetical protein
VTLKVDWEAIERDYRIGIKSLRQLGVEACCSHVAIQKRAAKEGWKRDIMARARGREESAEKVVLDVDQWGVAGFIYVIYLDDSAGERFYKIGMAASFTPRFQNHQCSSPFDICVACAYYVGNMRAEERSLHDIFKDKRVRGEWFRLDDDDLDLISTRTVLV